MAKAVKLVHGADNSPMRIDLKVPYTERDTAKALGARWALMATQIPPLMDCGRDAHY